MRTRRWSARIFCAALRLLPRSERARAGTELEAMFAARLAECTTGLQALRVTAGEVAGVARLAVLLLLRPRARPAIVNKELSLMDRLLQDLRFALRTFARRPTHVLLVVLTFALGIGATTAMFSVVDAVLLRPLPYAQPERIVNVHPTLPEWRTDARLSQYWDRANFSYPEFVDFRRLQKSFDPVAAYGDGQATLLGQGEPDRIEYIRATPEIFTVLGARPQLGRLFSARDEAPVVVLSNEIWQTRYGGDRAVLGRTIVLGSRSYPIVGVLEPGFNLAGHDGLLWRSIVAAPSEAQRGDHELRAIGRLRPGVSVVQASAEAERLISSFSTGDHVKHGGRVARQQEDLTGSFRLPLFVLIAAAFLLLVAACASVATMLLGNGIDRESELAIRAAMGARRGVLLRQLLTEGVLLGALGGLFGIGLARVIMQFLLALAPAEMPLLTRAHLDLRVLAFALLLSIVFAICFTMIPAFVLSRVNLAGSAGSLRVTRTARGRLQQGLVIAEIALATLLLTSAGLLTRTMMRLNAVDPGFRPDELLTVRIAPDYNRLLASAPRDASSGTCGPCPIETPELKISAYFGRITDALKSIPGVADVAVTSALPFSPDRGSNRVEPEGYTPKPAEVLDAERRFISANYVRTMGMRIVAGRDFTEADDRPDAAPVVLVNESLARRFWPNESAVGKHLGFWDQEPLPTIVGVVRDPRETDLRGETSSKFYVPAHKLSDGGGSVLVRTKLEPGTMRRIVRERLWSIDPTLAITEIVPMRERMRDSVADQRYRMRLMLAFSVLAAVFAVTGVYGVMSRAATRRRRELGIRSALGALYSELLQLMLRQGAALAGLGVLIGLFAAYFATRVLESMLYETSRADPLVIVAIAGVVIVLALLAAWQPARRAASVQPMDVLRSD